MKSSRTNTIWTNYKSPSTVSSKEEAVFLFFDSGSGSLQCSFMGSVMLYALYGGSWLLSRDLLCSDFDNFLSKSCPKYEISIINAQALSKKVLLCLFSIEIYRKTGEAFLPVGLRTFKMCFWYRKLSKTRGPGFGSSRR